MNDIRKYFQYLYSLERSSMKYGLSNIRRLLKANGDPHRRIKFIHIAGTNGKGGTASFLSSILIEHGFKTGLFTSPHILKFNERIRINGKIIPDSYIKGFLDDNKKVIEKIKPSFFEVNTALAFKYFSDKKADIAVIEAGLGGRLDSTNVVKPELIIITQIAIDHTDYLGKTLESIAKEKLGVVKPGVDVIVSDTNKSINKLFTSKVKPPNLFFLDKYIKIHPYSPDTKRNKFTFKWEYREKTKHLVLTSPLPGNYQLRNIASALFGAEKYLSKNDIKLSEPNVRRAIKKVKINSGYRCRFEKVKKGEITYIFDISHNYAGVKSALSNFSAFKPDAIVFAMMNDKDYRNTIKEILKTESNIIFTQPEYKRAIPAKELFEYAKSLVNANTQNIHLSSKVHEALKQAERLAGINGCVLIIGSFFLVSETIKKLKLQKLFN